MVSYPTQSSASGIWNIGDLSLYIQEGAWPPNPGNTALLGGGSSSGAAGTLIQRIYIPYLGNSTDFGNLSTSLGALGACSSLTRGLFGGGDGTTNVIEFVVFQTQGNSTDFGDLTQARAQVSSASNSTRGTWAGGYASAPTFTGLNTIDYVTLATQGNAQDFGDLSVARRAAGGLASPSRAVFAGGVSNLNVIDFITIASTGNATDFGDLVNGSEVLNAGASSATRGLFGESLISGVSVNTIDYITIASAGNAIDFGDLTTARFTKGASNTTRAVWMGGGTSPTYTGTNTIDFMTIATIGNATDFGDLTTSNANGGACSSGQGGLQ